MLPSTRRRALRAAGKVTLATAAVATAVACGGKTAPQPADAPEASIPVVVDDAAAEAPWSASPAFDGPTETWDADDEGTLVSSDAWLAADSAADTIAAPAPVCEMPAGPPSEATFQCCAAEVGRFLAVDAGLAGEMQCCKALVDRLDADNTARAPDAAVAEQAWSADYMLVSYRTLGECCRALGYPIGPACTPWGPPMPPAMPAEIA